MLAPLAPRPSWPPGEKSSTLFGLSLKRVLLFETRVSRSVSVRNACHFSMAWCLSDMCWWVTPMPKGRGAGRSKSYPATCAGKWQSSTCACMFFLFFSPLTLKITLHVALDVGQQQPCRAKCQRTLLLPHSAFTLRIIPRGCSQGTHIAERHEETRMLLLPLYFLWGDEPLLATCFFVFHTRMKDTRAHAPFFVPSTDKHLFYLFPMRCGTCGLCAPEYHVRTCTQASLRLCNSMR